MSNSTIRSPATTARGSSVSNQVLLSPIRNLRFAFLDVETTGAIASRGDRVTEVGILTTEAGEIVDRYAQLVNPHCRIPRSIIELTGISQEMVEDSPSFCDIQSDVARRLRGAIIVGHNIRFDLSFIRSEFDRVGVEHETIIDACTVVDTVRLARKAFGRSGNGLQRLAARLGLHVERAHRALADCLTTAQLFDRIIAPHGGMNLLLADLISLQGGPAKTTTPEPVPIELQSAIREQHHVQMTYLDSQNNPTHRVVIPIELCTIGKSRCVSAFCTLNQERRNFHLHRIIALTRIETLYDELSAEDGSAHDPIADQPEITSEDERIEP